jgi:hypothetical protein
MLMWRWLAHRRRRRWASSIFSRRSGPQAREQPPLSRFPTEVIDLTGGSVRRRPLGWPARRRNES